MLKVLLSIALIFFLALPISLAQPIVADSCNESLDPSLERVRSIKIKIENYSPTELKGSVIDPSEITFDPLPKNKMNDGVDESGATGEVRFGIYRGEPVAVKFFSRYGPSDEMNLLITHSYFVMSLVHELGFAPKPHAFFIKSDSSENFDHILKNAGLYGNDYIGLEIMERVRPAFHRKGYDNGLNKHIQHSQTLEDKINDAYAVLAQAGILPIDVDFMVTPTEDFVFIDFDSWAILTQSKDWYFGKMLKHNSQDQSSYLSGLKKVTLRSLFINYLISR